MTTTYRKGFQMRMHAERAMLMLPLNVVMIGRIAGDVDPEKLEQAVTALRKRHALLAVRVTFDQDGNLYLSNGNVVGRASIYKVVDGVPQIVYSAPNNESIKGISFSSAENMFYASWLGGNIYQVDLPIGERELFYSNPEHLQLSDVFVEDDSLENQHYQFYLYARNSDGLLVGKLMVVYDNGSDQAIGGGNITVHKPSKKK